LTTPLVFAHRGSVGEAPESTEVAFRHALVAGADVLELDVSLTEDRMIVVWHGPGMNNVYVDGCDGGRIGKQIGDVSWSHLEGKAWVLHPQQSGEVRSPARAMMSLKQFVSMAARLERDLSLTAVPWNIEIKHGRSWSERFDTLLDILDEESMRRRIVLAAAYGRNIERIRRRIDQRGGTGRYALNVSGERQMREILAPWLSSGRSLSGRAFQTSHGLVTPKLVARVHERGGAVHAFLTPFPLLKGVEHLGEAELGEHIERLLDCGVDGIMTDYPARVVPLVRHAAARRRGAAQAQSEASGTAGSTKVHATRTPAH
jgi:glycerophosphoryl diester phosphodiesterase